MKEDIRVIKQIGTISSNESNWQKELNIVSINNGPFVYDLREWSLDHTLSRKGISFDDEEAKVLLAVLKECFKDCGEGITIDLYPGAFKANTSGQFEMSALVEDESTQEADEALYSLLKEKGIEFTDKREKGGALWVIGGHELDSVMTTCRELGYKFYFSEKGGRVTKGKAGWYLRANK